MDAIGLVKSLRVLHELHESLNEKFKRHHHGTSTSKINTAYEYTTEKNVATPFLKTLTPELMPDARWVMSLHKVLAEAVARKYPELLKPSEDAPPLNTPQGLQADIARLSQIPVIQANFSEGQRATSLQDYVAILQDSVENVKGIWSEGKPVISDVDFCEHRLSGPNPITISPCREETLSILHLQDNEELRLLLKRNKLFAIDYSVLATLHTSTSLGEGVPKIATGSIALFKQESHSLKPVCIQVISKTGDVFRSRVVFPDGENEGSANGGNFNWEIAKAVFQCNDANFHEGVSHLALTHLVSEIFLVATYRHFAPDHPLFKLLTPHFEGTAYINESANTRLIADGSSLDKMTSFRMSDLRGLILEAVNAYTASDMSFPARLRARKMDTESVRDLEFAYRDDGLLLWKAISRWTRKYVSFFYKYNEDISQDKSLRAWIEELRDPKGGNVAWLTNFPYHSRALSRLLASIIFIASVDHAAVNFPQRDFMQYVPSFPLALYGEDDSVLFKPETNMADYLSLLPPLPVALIQSMSAYLLGGFIHVTLGNYGNCSDAGEYFNDTKMIDGCTDEAVIEKVKTALKSFQRKLNNITSSITERNKTRSHNYTTLLPANIPQSINV